MTETEYYKYRKIANDRFNSMDKKHRHISIGSEITAEINWYERMFVRTGIRHKKEKDEILDRIKSLKTRLKKNVEGRI